MICHFYIYHNKIFVKIYIFIHYINKLKVLKESGKGGVILLLTDGEENEHPYIYEVLLEIIAAEVRVVSIAFG